MRSSCGDYRSDSAAIGSADGPARSAPRQRMRGNWRCSENRARIGCGSAGEAGKNRAVQADPFSRPLFPRVSLRSMSLVLLFLLSRTAGPRVGGTVGRGPIAERLPSLRWYPRLLPDAILFLLSFWSRDSLAGHCIPNVTRPGINGDIVDD